MAESIDKDMQEIERLVDAYGRAPLGESPERRILLTRIRQMLEGKEQKPTYITWDVQGVRYVNGVPDPSPSRQAAGTARELPPLAQRLRTLADKLPNTADCDKLQQRLRQIAQECAQREGLQWDGWKYVPLQQQEAQAADGATWHCDKEPYGHLRCARQCKECAEMEAPDPDDAASTPQTKPPETDDGGPLRDGWQITIGPGHAGYGVYAHMTEYPEEGAVCLATFDPNEYPDAAAPEAPQAGEPMPGVPLHLPTIKETAMADKLRTALDVTLTRRELVGDDGSVRLLVGDGHSGYGLYAAHPEYPEEGAIFIKELPAPREVEALSNEEVFDLWFAAYSDRPVKERVALTDIPWAEIQQACAAKWGVKLKGDGRG